MLNIPRYYSSLRFGIVRIQTACGTPTTKLFMKKLELVGLGRYRAGEELKQEDEAVEDPIG